VIALFTAKTCCKGVDSLRDSPDYSDLDMVAFLAFTISVL
jgi:hypothetical protein